MANPTKSRVTWPTPSSGSLGPTSNSYHTADRHGSRRSYGRGTGAHAPALANKPRVIITYDGKSLGQSDTRLT